MNSIARLLPRRALLASRRAVSSRQLVYEGYGDPEKVLSLKTVELPAKPSGREVRVQWLAAPMNPADINQVQGVYPIKPKLPAVGGSEGCGQVVQVGEGVSELAVGDRVIPAHSGLGCWRTMADYGEEHVVKISKDLPLEAAASFQVNPPTAYRMLTDFVDLKSGDVMVQNGATSTVGRAAIQIAKARGVRTVNVVRDCPEAEQLKAELLSLGADVAVTEEQMRKLIKQKPLNARLALNCVGGKSTMSLAGALGKGGVMVTYGGMSKQPIQIPTGPLIFKDIKLVGFWMSNWYTKPEHRAKRDAMYKDLTEFVLSGQFRTPNFAKVKLDDWQTAIREALGGSLQKQLLIF